MEYRKPVVAWESRGMRIVVSLSVSRNYYAVHEDDSRKYSVKVTLEEKGSDSVGNEKWDAVEVPDYLDWAFPLLTAVADSADNDLPAEWWRPDGWLIKEPKEVERIDHETGHPYR